MLLAVYYRVMEHLGSLESTQEARVALGYRLGQLLRFFRTLQTSRVLHNSIVYAKAWTNCFYIITQVILAFWVVLAYDLLEDRRTTDVIITKFFSLLF